MRSIDEQIRQAMQDGKFDNLPGKGKPLKLEDNPHEDPEWRLVHHVLHNGGFSLPWIEARHTIESELEAARSQLRRGWEWRQGALQQGDSPAKVEEEWRRAIEKFHAQLAAINTLIRTYNLQTPSARFNLRELNAAKEVDQISSV